MNNLKKYIHYLIIAVIFFIGLFFRIKIYLYNRPLWLDECFIFHNANLKGFWEMFGVLSYKQTAPPLFMWIEKFLIIAFGIKEQVVRFFPFMCSILSIPVFYKFSKIFLNKNFSVIIANLLFAVNVQLIYYAQETKQYSSDVLLFMLLFIILNSLTIKCFGKKQIIYYSIITIIFPLLSIPSYFLIGAWILKELITYKFEYLKKLIIINIPVFIVSVFYCIKAVIPQHKIFIDSFTYLWGEGFLKLDMVSNTKLFMHNMNYFFEPCNLGVMFLCSALIGACLLLKNYKQNGTTMLLWSIFIILLFSYMGIYPIFERVCLYTLPIVLILITKTLDIISINKKFVSLIIIIFTSIPFIKYLKFHSIIDFVNVRFQKSDFTESLTNYPNPRELMNILKKKYNRETIIVNNPSKTEYEYYKLYYNFNPSKEEIFTTYMEIGPKNYKKELDKLTQQPGNYIFFFSNDYTKMQYELRSLKNWKKRYHTLYEKDLGNSYILFLNIE